MHFYFLFLFLVSVRLCSESVCLYPGEFHLISWSLDVFSADGNWQLHAFGSCLRVNCKFMWDIRLGQGTVV